MCRNETGLSVLLWNINRVRSQEKHDLHGKDLLQVEGIIGYYVMLTYTD